MGVCCVYVCLGGAVGPDEEAGYSDNIRERHHGESCLCVCVLCVCVSVEYGLEGLWVGRSGPMKKQVIRITYENDIMVSRVYGCVLCLCVCVVCMCVCLSARAHVLVYMGVDVWVCVPVQIHASPPPPSHPPHTQSFSQWVGGWVGE